MNFRVYDILSSLVPGFISLMIILRLLEIQYDKDWAVPYTAVAFLLGFLINTTASWLEGFYYFTWGGKPSTQLLNGKYIWKVSFYHSKEVKELLKKESSGPNASDDELFSIAMRYANGSRDSRVEDFNSMFAFSRSLLTCILIGSIVLIIQNYFDWRYYSILLPALILIWLRCKQRGYYYAKEVLDVYLRIKK